MTGAAQAAIKEAAAAAKSGEKIPPLGAHESMTGLVNESVLTPLLTEAMGPFQACGSTLPSLSLRLADSSRAR